MSIRLDPRRVQVLKRLASEADTRPGDLVRRWVEERLDAARQGVDTPEAATTLAAQLNELTQRVAALETAADRSASSLQTAPVAAPAPDADASPDTVDLGAARPGDENQADAPEADAPEADAPEAADEIAAVPRKRVRRVSAAPPTERVALHDEMIAVLAERGPMSAGELAAAIVERGRYAPPRSGKPLDAAMVSQRVSNPTYRSRFTRNEGRIGLAEAGE